MEDSPAVLQSVTDGVGILTLNRPSKFNCISRALVAGLSAGIDAFEGDADVRAIVINAEGKQFCTGADLAEIKEANGDQTQLTAFTRTLHGVLRRLETSDLPVIAAVQGLALAGGLELVMGCDIVFAAQSAQLGDQHSQYGLVPGGGNSQRLPRVVGRRRALDLMFSHRWLSAEEAMSWGLVNYVVADAELDQAAMDYARKLAGLSAEGLATMKRLVWQGLDMSEAESLEFEARVAGNKLAGADTIEGLDAFANRREPKFAPRVVN
jgi:enoyl-CoA hydratase